MGITNSTARFIIQARRRGVCFDSVLTIGRQYTGCSPQRLAAYVDECGCWPDGMEHGRFIEEMEDAPWRFEHLLRLLGAQTVESCDASPYEGASIVHDLNQPVALELHRCFDLVVDAGTLEHVFNFPVAMRNCMEMVREGGHLIVASPANNYLGHGFYQFSPELFWRVLSPANGFRVERMVAVVDDGGRSRLLGIPYHFRLTSPWYEVKDPAALGRRVTLLSRDPVTLMVLARRTALRPVFAETPQQSDYVQEWASGPARPAAAAPASERISEWLRGTLPRWAVHRAIPALAAVLDPGRAGRWRRRNSLGNREFFTRVRE